MRALLILMSLVMAPLAAAERPEIEWASFPVERLAYQPDEKTAKYSTTGTFDGIGMLYFSPAKKKIEYKGLRSIRIPYLGQESNDRFELRAESFVTTSVISLGNGEFAFEAVVQGPFERTVTGRLRIKAAPPAFAATVVEFRMDELGDLYEGVMSRYTLPASDTALAMLKKYDEIFFGGNFVALAPPR
jgi:hypothetical protein